MTIEGSVCTRLGFLVPRPSVATLAVRIREGSMYFRIRAWISGGDSEFVWASIIIVAFVWIVGSVKKSRLVPFLTGVGRPGR
jgi:hypothetical protein